MTNLQWERTLRRMIKNAEKTLGYKAGVYADDKDRFFNFKRAAAINRVTPEQAAWGMATKHLVAVQDLIEGRVTPEPERIEEAFGDLRNYLFLIEGMFKESLS